MAARMFLPLIMIAGVAQAASLPLRAGTYVLADVPCSDPPFAALFDYDGQHFSYPHATKCVSVITARAGATYGVRETCSALGDGTPTAPSTISARYRILSPDRVSIRQASAGKDRVYRRCAPSRPGGGL